MTTDDIEHPLVEHLSRAGEMLKAENLAGAEREVDEAIKLAPDDDRTKNLLGLVRFRAGRYDDAYAVYRELVKKTPDDLAIRLNLGLVELRIGKHAEAAEDLRRIVEKEPRNVKAQGYYGLALMRSGELLRARDAFVAAGQADLARQVDERLAKSKVQAAGPADAPAPQATTPTVDAEGGLEVRGLTLVQGRKRLPVELPRPLDAFLSARELRPGEANAPFTVAEGGILIVRVDGRLPTRTIGALASSGRLAYVPMTRRLRGRASEEPFGEGDDGVFAASGAGLVVVSPRGGTFTALSLSNEVLYARESSVFAFEETLYWENGRVPGGGPEGFRVVQLRGDGRMVIRSKRDPYTLRLGGGEVLYVEQEALLGWSGQVVPQQLRGTDGAPTQYIACTGDGALLLEEPVAPGSQSLPQPVIVAPAAPVPVPEMF